MRRLVVSLLLGMCVVGLGVGTPGCGGGSSHKPAVLVVYTETLPGWGADVITKLAAFGVFSAVDGFDAFPATPSLANLQAYDAVLVMGSASFSDDALLGDNLADYVDAGGGVVIAGYSWQPSSASTPNGRFETDDYTVIPRTAAAQFDGPFGLFAIDAVHPILSGVVTFGGGTNSTRPGGALVPGGYDVVAVWTDASASPLVATRTIGGVRRVDLGLFPPTQDAGQAGFLDPTSDAMRVVANSLRWTAGDL